MSQLFATAGGDEAADANTEIQADLQNAQEVFEGEKCGMKINNNRAGALLAGEAMRCQRHELRSVSPFEVFFRITIASDSCQGSCSGATPSIRLSRYMREMKKHSE